MWYGWPSKVLSHFSQNCKSLIQRDQDMKLHRTWAQGLLISEVLLITITRWSHFNWTLADFARKVFFDYLIHYNLLSCKYFIMLFIFSHVLISSAEIISSFLILHSNNQSFINPFITSVHILLSSSFITSVNWIDVTAVLHITTYSCKIKSVFCSLAIKGTKSFNLFHPLLLLVITLSNLPPLSLCCVTKIIKHFQETGH